MKKETDVYFEGLETAESLTTGARWAVRAWKNSADYDSSEFECDQMPFESDMEDFSNTLMAAGIETLAITEASTATIANIHALCRLGWKLDGPCEVTRTQYGRTKTVLGLRMKA